MKTRQELLASDKPFGWEVDVELCDRMIYIPASDANRIESFHYVGTESNARRKGILKPHARAILVTRSFTYRQWIACFGEGRM